MSLLLAAPVARDLARQPERLAAVAACPALLELPVPHLLLAGCLGKVEAAVVVVPGALAVQAELEVAALVVAVAVLRAVHTTLALVA